MAKTVGHGYSPLPKATAPIFDPAFFRLSCPSVSEKNHQTKYKSPFDNIYLVLHTEIAEI